MKHSVENPVEYFNFKNLNFIIHPLFLKTLADKKVNEWKLNNPTITIYAEIINDILRVQHFSNSHGVKGVLVLHDSALSLELANEKLKDFKNLTFFELHVYADIKQYLFQYKIIHLNVENPSRKFTPIEPIDVQFEKLASVVSYPDGIVANDLNHSVYLIRNTMKLSHHNIIKNVANSVALNTQIHVYSQNKSFAVVVSESGSVSINCIHLPIRLVDLKSILDPATLVLESSMLNLSLMKWRILPDFDLKKNTGIKCLILGAGTLGCNVIRCLLGWGVLHFTLVDSGNVSYSNPIRQSLYTVHDVGKSKVESAKLRIMDIAPYATVEAINIRIPMPDHVSDTTSSDTVQLWELIKVHDAIFLLTDSRESRWLPTTLGRYENKIVLTAALGFDSLLALKHSEEQGCYFCSDVVAPVNVVCTNLVIAR
eukprot:NODE_618_length_5937_cov_0.118191.p2 type:complete len:426 gc:universal NODE_618_length_5937_cov_0.118191:2625-1348(-)